MNEEEKKAMELLENIRNNSWTTKYIMSSDSKNVEVLLNLIDKMKNCINILDDELKERNKIINEKEIIIEKLQKENEELKNIELKSKGGAIKVSLEGVLSLENKIKQLEKENEELKFKERSRIIGEYGDTEIHDVINKTLSNDYISVQKVKDIIDRIDYDIKKTKEIISKNTKKKQRNITYEFI